MIHVLGIMLGECLQASTSSRKDESNNNNFVEVSNIESNLSENQESNPGEDGDEESSLEKIQPE